MSFYPNAHLFEEVAVAVIPVLFSALPSLAIAVASYVLTALALYTLATRRGIKKAWLSWIPVLNLWIYGSLSDQYRYVVKGQCKSKRKSLLILNLLSCLIGLMVAAVAIGALGTWFTMGYQADPIGLATGALLTAAVLCLPLMGLSIAAAVIRYMALYDIYASTDPGNKILFLLLSIFFHFTEPFFLFFSRNRDEGMPPRKQQPQYQPPEYDSGEPDCL